MNWSLPDTIAELVATGDGDFVAGLIEAFQTETALRLARVHSAMADGDAARVRAEAHAIKGGARQMGGDAMADLCQQIELDPAAQNLAEQVARLETTFASLCQEMNAVHIGV